MRLPVKHYTTESPLVPVINGEPWSHYELRYRLKYGTSVGVITSRDASRRQFLMRTIGGRDTDEKIQRVRQLCHDNIVKGIEIYISEPGSYLLVSEFMPTTIQHICRSPIYPNEPQLSSMLFQILQGLQSSPTTQGARATRAVKGQCMKEQRTGMIDGNILL
ncbi:uncharacterized protein B0I36DRAFT_315173 [Microdochium trichocladiopsis]|uniref:Protein kinase domain-containing protein n=1 Tax=Microdochium trichocladiopsis TaxID=1682393 RepID=A0A9P8YH05_9PEZI|nr:uncharacterized protein B0I36DRAFT_315173 [Microdochium trichocladiopsis]KAH7037965.1 hypothetical protein B0I36DRAFT_315173 [Microdochium trichocladiopsis]